MSAVTETSLDAGGLSIRCLEGGQGPRLIFLHGMGGLPVAAPFLDRLADSYRVLVPEHPGFGETDALPWVETVADLATYYTGLLRHTLGGERVFLVGHSLGGWLATEIAFANPDVVGRQVLAAPAGIRGETEAPDPFMLDEEALLSLAVAEPASAPPAPDPTERAAIRNREMTARLAWSPRFADPKLPMRLARTATPTLLAWGAYDRIIPPDRAATFAESLRDARLVTIANAGHLPMVEVPEAFVAEVTAFLTG